MAWYPFYFPFEVTGGYLTGLPFLVLPVALLHYDIFISTVTLPLLAPSVLPSCLIPIIPASPGIILATDMFSWNMNTVYRRLTLHTKPTIRSSLSRITISPARMHPLRLLVNRMSLDHSQNGWHTRTMGSTLGLTLVSTFPEQCLAHRSRIISLMPFLPILPLARIPISPCSMAHIPSRLLVPHIHAPVLPIE